MPSVRRNDDDIARFGDDLLLAHGVDPASLVHHEHFAAGVPVLDRTLSRWTVAHHDRKRAEAMVYLLDGSKDPPGVCSTAAMSAARITPASESTMASPGSITSPCTERCDAHNVRSGAYRAAVRCGPQPALRRYPTTATSPSGRASSPKLDFTSASTPNPSRSAGIRLVSTSTLS